MSDMAEKALSDTELAEMLLCEATRDVPDHLPLELSRLWRLAAHRMEELTAERDRLREALEWRDIESAPLDGEVLLFGPHKYKGFYIQTCAYFRGGVRDCWPIIYMDGHGEPTHWMPCPSPPDAAIAEKEPRDE